MATEHFYFHGEAIWCRVHAEQKDQKYDRYSIGVFLDEDSMERFKASEMQILPKQDKETGREFYQFARKNSQLIKGELVEFGTPHIFLASSKDIEERFTGQVGNGSEVTVKVAVYDSKKGKGHRLESVRVDNLVEYSKPTVEAGVDSPW